MSKKVRRLYEQFQPENYGLTLCLDRKAMTFSGTVTIHGKKTGRPSQRLTFHQKELKITAAKITKRDKKGDQPVEVVRINKQNSFDEVRLHAKGMVFPGEYTVTMEFSGKITRTMHGIYPCHFKHGGKDKIIMATQFESHHAREAFPCIDEPEAKATFDLSLVTPGKEVSLSNTAAKNQKTTKSGVETTFETSPKMSTYLLAFVTGELHGVTGKTKDGIEVRSWASVAQPKDHLKYANDEAIKCLEFFIDYFQTPFPLPKLDQVAVPDFEVLAMENWGLITFREVGLLSDPRNRSLSGEQLITLVIAHEVSHQWFGNLVTMKWWDDLWLNESFASIMENIAPDHLHPDWHQWEDFATSRVLSASQRDIYKDVQPVGLTVNHPDEIATVFDPAIVYAKGARLLTMLRDYVGEDVFRKGLGSYFKKHAYGNTSRTDLWEEFGLAGGQDINKIMAPWIRQSGQPLLTVSRRDGKLKLGQKRFLLDGEDNQSLWPIPLLADRKLAADLMTERSMELSYTDKTMPVFNIEGSGHFIVGYKDNDSREGLKSKVVSRSIDAIGRINVVNDMLLLARANEYSMAEILDLVRQAHQEPRSAVWTMFMRSLGQAHLLVDGDETTEQDINGYKRGLAEYWYEKLGWTDRPDDGPNTKHLRTSALSISLAGENPDAIRHALALFGKADSVEKLPAEQRAMVAGVAVRFGKPDYVKQLMDEYAASHNPDVQESIAAALCATKKPEVAKRLIEWGLKKDGAVRPQDIGHWFAYLMRNYRTRELTWNWLTASWPRLLEQFDGGKYMEYFIWYSSGPLSTPEWQTRFKKFFEPKINEPSLKRNIQVGLSEIAARVEWRQREEDRLKKYFKQAGRP